MPRLIVVDGVLKGSVFPLTGSVVSIGRGTSNTVIVDDHAASRYHCSIEMAGGRYKLTDLESRNGTFVNGVPVRQRLLEHGDQIKIGLSVFLFSTAAADEAEVPSSNPEITFTKTQSTSLLRVDDAIYLQPAKLDQSVAPSNRVARHLNALLRISTEIHKLQSREPFYQRLLELILQVIPAASASLFLSATGPDACEFAFGLRFDGTPSAQSAVDRDIVRQVLGDGLAIIADASESPQAGSVIMAAPLVCFGKYKGMLLLQAMPKSAPFDDDDLQLLAALGSIAGLALGNVDRFENLEAENVRLKLETQLQHDMIGESPAMRSVYDFIARVARSDASVLIGGENGTGKELAARAIHRNSARSARPFIAINCATLTESLLESELFGHEKGAFTGAVGLKKGKFELADSGTIFLDEIGELAPALQAKLLRVLQQHEIERVGGTKPIKIDVRVIAATNRDLHAATKEGAFRQDLYFRLNVISLNMPALRQRREDIPLLANYFAAKAAARAGRRNIGISEKARKWLLAYEWPGNVRELENAIERAVVLGSSDLIMPEDLPEGILEVEASEPLAIDKYHEALNHAKRDVVLRALEQARGVQTEAAKILEIHPVYLHRLMRKLNLKGSAQGSADNLD